MIKTFDEFLITEKKWTEIEPENIPYDRARPKDAIMVEYDLGRGVMIDYYIARGSNEWMKSGIHPNTTINKGNIIKEIKDRQINKELVSIKINF
ncbi:hypothetical protein [uncultured Methanobrevibacter sp.]|uniref:hypothetical protein n=1 Tax=uncultured Methanobrevibacter sp. TaxID=253161 RepID=UPI0025F0AA13|nr:hypothetical protein [uncultured Methanobrevibacter sp.]